ncbi:MAG: energy transducer TonB [Nitrospirae bacterium]|nr:energy transducer TonB [Nitrospirota bacterium]
MKPSALGFYDSDQHFKRIAWICVLLYGAVALVINLVTVEAPERQDYTRLSPRIAKLMIEASKPLPPPPVPLAKQEEPKAEQTSPGGKKEEAPSESPQEQPQEVAKQAGPTAEEIQAQQEAQRKKNMDVAMNSGLLKLLKQSETKTESESVPDQKLKKVFSEIKGLSQTPQTTPGAALQLSPGASRGIDEIVAKLEQSIQESKSAGGNPAATGSGGINPIIGDLQKDLGRSSLAERKTTAVESPFKIKGFEDGKSPRTYESIAQVVDSYKGGISFLYNKALRENPTLRGTVTVEFIIAANGEVIDCRVVSSSMSNPLFEESLLKRVLQWKFPPVPAGDVTITYPIVFSVAG